MHYQKYNKSATGLLSKIALLTVVFASSVLLAGSNIYDITSLMTDPSGELDTIDGKSVKLNTPITNGHRVLFEDTLPGANWGHPAIYKVVNARGETLEAVKASMPPLQLSLADLLSGLPASNYQEVEFKLSDFDGKYKVANPENYYAFLFNGHADRRHWNDFSFLYRVLTDIYGYKEENIIVADGAYKDRLGDLDGDGDNDIAYGSDRADLEAVLKKLAEDLGPDDQLIFAVNDHGSTMAGESTIVLYDGEIKASEFKKLFDKLPAKRILSIYEQCFSGGFVRPSVSDTRVAMAAATDTEYSWASMDLLFDEFIYHVIAAFAMQSYDGKPINSDVNKDGKVSAKEAFGYAVLNDLRKESPILESGRNAGSADTIGLGF